MNRMMQSTRLLTALFLGMIAAVASAGAQDYRYNTGAVLGTTVGVTEGEDVAFSGGLRALLRYALEPDIRIELGAGIMNVADDGSRHLDSFDVSTNVIPIDLRLILAPWSHLKLSPYVYAGFGAGYFSVEEPPTFVPVEERDASGFIVLFPVGIGANVWLADRLSIDAQAGSYMTLSDDLNPIQDQSNDAWWSMMVGLLYSFGDPPVKRKVASDRETGPGTLEGTRGGSDERPRR